MSWQDDYASRLFVFGTPLRLLVRGEGPWVWDETGKRYLDLLGGIAVNVLGHAHPAVVAAVEKQVRTLGHISNFFTSPPQLELAGRLLELARAPEGSRVFLVNSGTEANEAAIKMALRHRPRGRMVALEDSFHGRTLGSLSLTAKAAYREPFEPLHPVTFVPPGDVEALAAALDDDVAAVFVEVIQGEAGVRPLDPGYVRAARDLTRASGALLVVDEVQTGAGRTGEWLAHPSTGITPDIVTMAKGLGGGFPIGAVIGYGPTTGLLLPGQHGTTFGGNPIASAVALAVIGEVLPLLDHVAALGEWWRAELAAVPGVVAVRGRGLLIGVELDRPSGPVQQALLDAGFITNNVNPTTLRLAPPLILTRDQAESFTQALAGTLASTEGENPHD
ncbi:MAG: acetylornithine transaminase [Actinobacteria bacterium]|nr:acetylornithine transaminase [Actinomycetota bacterium]